MFSVRPRGAFFHALLGFVDAGWAKDGLIDMVAQILLSVFGGYMAFIGAMGTNKTMDPSRPDWWKTYLAGGAMASITTDLIALYVILSFLSLAFFCCGGLYVFGVMVAAPIALVWKMLVVEPFKEVWVMLGNIYRCVRRRRREEIDTFGWTIGLGYSATMFVSLVLCVGCWMFWNGFVRLSGELYCPQDLSYIDVTMVGFYALSVMIRKLFSFLLGETASIEHLVSEKV